MRPILCRLGSLAMLGALLATLGGCGGDQSAGDEGAQAPTVGAAALPRSEAAPGATVFIISPTNGATVTSPVNVKFGVSGIEIQPAGTAANNSGHHHLLIDTDLASSDQPIPTDAQHLHFGKGQTEASVELEPGEHRLQLVLGDRNHVPHLSPVTSGAITINVVAE